MPSSVPVSIVSTDLAPYDKSFYDYGCVPVANGESLKGKVWGLGSTPASRTVSAMSVAAFPKAEHSTHIASSTVLTSLGHPDDVLEMVRNEHKKGSTDPATVAAVGAIHSNPNGMSANPSSIIPITVHLSHSSSTATSTRVSTNAANRIDGADGSLVSSVAASTGIPSSVHGEESGDHLIVVTAPTGVSSVHSRLNVKFLSSSTGDVGSCVTGPPSVTSVSKRGYLPVPSSVVSAPTADGSSGTSKTSPKCPSYTSTSKNISILSYDYACKCTGRSDE